jgi:DNA-binding transcriptional LysR family regulator
LLHRGSRGAVATRAGETLYQRTRPALATLREAEVLVRQMDEVPRGLLRLALPPAIAMVVAPALESYMQRCPEVQLEVLSSNRFVDFKAEQFDVAIRAGALKDSDLVGRRLLSSDVFPMASPEYIEQHGLPKDTREIAKHACLLGFDHAERPSTRWPLRDGGWLRVKGRFVSNDRDLLISAAVGGRGIALLTAFNTQEELASGALVPVLPELVGGKMALFIVYADGRDAPPKVRAFVEEVVSFFETADTHA